MEQNFLWEKEGNLGERIVVYFLKDICWLFSTMLENSNIKFVTFPRSRLFGNFITKRNNYDLLLVGFDYF